MPVLNVLRVADALSERRVREKIVCDYSLTDPPQDPLGFADAVVDALCQPVISDAAHRDTDNDIVFRAAVRAIASSSRRWSAVIAVEPQLRALLHGYDPVAVRDRLTAQDEDHINEIIGGYRRLGARSIRTWADRLADSAPYSDNLADLADALQALNTASARQPLTDPDLMLCAVSYLSMPAPTHWDGEPLLRTADRWPREARKLPGMGIPLGSEFLRNLGWNGFKPDRHVRRLLRAWVPDVIAECKPKAIRLAALAGRRDKGVREDLQLCLAGNALSPDGNHSRTDNLIWLIGAYVETVRTKNPRPPDYYIVRERSRRLGRVDALVDDVGTSGRPL